jgi:phenylacetate-coenzyme A ligase PaaK-like adenylate-forming protein
MLMELMGRSNDTLQLGDVRISPSATTLLFAPLEHLKRYHIVQDAPLHVMVTLDVEAGFDKRAAEESVTLAFVSRCPAVSIVYIYNALPLPTDGSKWRSVVVLDSARHEACDHD